MYTIWKYDKEVKKLSKGDVAVVVLVDNLEHLVDEHGVRREAERVGELVAGQFAGGDVLRYFDGDRLPLTEDDFAVTRTTFPGRMQPGEDGGSGAGARRRRLERLHTHAEGRHADIVKLYEDIGITFSEPKCWMIDGFRFFLKFSAACYGGAFYDKSKEMRGLRSSGKAIL